MPTRLPTPGSDDGTWGNILNDFLSQSHNPDGTLKPLTQAQVQNLTADLAAKARTADLAPVATSGSYTDLTNKPTIPDATTLVANSDLDTKTNALIMNASSATSVSLKAVSVAAAKESGAFAPAAQRTVNGVKHARIMDTVTTFQTGHGFTVLGGAANVQSFTDDSTEFAIGSQSVAVTLKTDNFAGSIQKTAAPAVNATGKDLTITVRIDDTTNLTELIVYASNDNTFASYYQWTVQDNGLEAQRWFKSGEWQMLTLSFAAAAVVGTPDRAALTAFRVRARTANGFTTTVRYNRIGTAAAATSAVVSICADDIYASNWSVMRPILDKYGFPATVFAIPERATDALVPVGKLHQLEDVNGWEIAGHGLTDLTTMSLAAAEAEVVATRVWLQNNGFRGVDNYAYPGGGFSPAIEAIMRRYYRSGRTIVSRLPHETTPPANPYRLRSRSVSNTTPAATVTGDITNAKNNNSWYILTFHDIVTANANVGTQYLAADLDTICAHIASQGVAVKTVGEVLAGQ